MFLPNDTQEFTELRMAHGVGPLFELGVNPGSLVFADEILAAPGEPLRGTLLDIKHSWRELFTREQFQSGQTPRHWDTKEAAEADGMTTEWIHVSGVPGVMKPSAGPVATAYMALEHPITRRIRLTNLPGEFLQDWKRMLPAYYVFRGVGYREFSKFQSASPLAPASQKIVLRSDIRKRPLANVWVLNIGWACGSKVG